MRYLGSLKIICFFSLYLCCTLFAVGNELLEKSPFPERFHEILGDHFFETREVPGNLELSQKYYRLALKANPKRYHLLWKLSRGCWTGGDRTIDKNRKIYYFKQAVTYGERAIEKNEKSPDSHLWLGFSMGSLAIERGIIESIAQKEKIRKEFLTTIELQPNNILAHWGLASWYYHVPKVFGGNKHTSYQLLDKAHSLDPNYTQTMLLKARFLIDENRFFQAEELLKEIIQTEKPTSQAGGIEDKASARVLLEQLKQSL